MYTLEEIEQTASAKSWRVFWTWLLAFGIPMVLITFMIYQDRYLSKHYLLPLIVFDPLVIFSAFFYAGSFPKRLQEKDDGRKRI